MNGNYAFFVSASWDYLPYLNVLLNSLDKYGINIPVHLIGYDMRYDYIEKIISVFDYPIFYHEDDIRDFNIKLDDVGKNLFVKQSRFKYILENGLNYDAICMLDADMWVVSKNYVNWFDLVKDTKLLIGCEESFKWTFDKKHTHNDKPLFDNPVKAYKFMCSVPIIFDLKKWENVFKTYNDLAFQSWEMENGQKKKRIGDIYTWSISVYLNHRENDCILYPMHGMTQVHGTAGAFWCAAKHEGDKWLGQDGTEIYSLHGRVGTKNWRSSQINWYANTLKNHDIEYRGKVASICERSLDTIQKEWYDLNFRHKINLYDFYKQNELWDRHLSGKYNNIQ